MNMRLYMVVLGAAGAMALGSLACSSDDTGGGTGGSSSATGGPGSGGTGNVGPGTGGTGNVGGGEGGTGGSGACRTCAAYVTDAARQMSLEPTGDPLCAGSDAIWEALVGCGCDQCGDMCTADTCPGVGTADNDDACGECLGSQIGAEACAAETMECVNDA